MYLHANARLGLAGRVALVRAIEGGLSGHVRPSLVNEKAGRPTGKFPWYRSAHIRLSPLDEGPFGTPRVVCLEDQRWSQEPGIT